MPISGIPAWASDIVARMMELPMCGYYAYPDNVTQVIDALAAQQCPDVVMRCYTVDPGRKVLLSYYVYWLDAWLIAEIGSIGCDSPSSQAPAILQCEDTYPDFDANHEHFVGLVGRVRGWLEGQPDQVPSLGPSSAVKHWLVHLLWHQLRFLAAYEGTFARFVGARAHGKGGTRVPVG